MTPPQRLDNTSFVKNHDDTSKITTRDRPAYVTKEVEQTTSSIITKTSPRISRKSSGIIEKSPSKGVKAVSESGAHQTKTKKMHLNTLDTYVRT